MKTILEIYAEYKIMSGLQMHQLRVAAVASLICDNFDGSLNKEEIITACLLHDMGNIIKADLNYFPEFLEPEGLEYWQKVKDAYLEKYGNNEHQATLQILRELGLESLSEYVEAIDFRHLEKNIEVEDFGTKICYYADSRVTPLKIVSIEQRLLEAKERYGKRNGYAVSDEEREASQYVLLELEKQIFAKCKIKPEDINNDSATSVISELSNFRIMVSEVVA